MASGSFLSGASIQQQAATPGKLKIFAFQAGFLGNLGKHHGADLV